jgi:hypothetical protein
MIGDLIEQFSDIYIIYYTMYNGDVKVVRRKKNAFPEYSFDVDGIKFTSTPLIVAVGDNILDRAFVYICVFAESYKDSKKIFALTEEDAIKFKEFLKNITPNDFKQYREE